MVSLYRPAAGHPTLSPVFQFDQFLELFSNRISSLLDSYSEVYLCAADFSLLNLPKGKSLGRSKPATSNYAQALQHTVRDDSYYIQALLNCLL